MKTDYRSDPVKYSLTKKLLKNFIFRSPKYAILTILSSEVENGNITCLMRQLYNLIYVVLITIIYIFKTDIYCLT